MRNLERDDRVTVNGEDMRVGRVYDEYGTAPYDRVLECYAPGGAKHLLIIYPDEVRLTTGFHEMNRGDFELVEDQSSETETEQRKLVTDGGTEETEVSQDDWKPKCWDCGTQHDRRNLQTREVIDTSGPGIGYETITAPICRRCIGKRFGYDCPQCGITHDEKESAEYCCKRRPGEAPDCKECGRRMERGSWGVTAGGRQTVEWAECEACGIGWGRFTGWEDLDEEAINRAEWSDYHGFAEVSDHDILVHAYISDSGRPTLDVYAGGEFDERVGEYAGGLVYTRVFERVWSLDETVGELEREYDLNYLGSDLRAE